jgi:hypothetical protein
MKLRILLSILLCASGLAYAAMADYRVPPVISVEGPTIVAFFPVTDSELKDAETNEALSDFQHNASQVEKPLQKRGIKLFQSYAASFHLKFKTNVRVFTPEKGQCGYYFITPGQKPHVEYGVMTDEDLLQEAKKYLKQ